jgi:hypothetical protein
MYINQSSMYTARISVWWGTDPWLSHCRRCEVSRKCHVRTDEHGVAASSAVVCSPAGYSGHLSMFELLAWH